MFFGLDKFLFPMILRLADRLLSLSPSSLSSQSLDDEAKRSTRVSGELADHILVGLFEWVRGNAESVSFFVAYFLDIVVQRKYLHLSLMVLQSLSLIDVLFDSHKVFMLTRCQPPRLFCLHACRYHRIILLGGIFLQ